MKIKINGTEKVIDKVYVKASLSNILDLLGYKPNTIVVELNNLIVNSKNWDKEILTDGDILEIVSIVGGG